MIKTKKIGVYYKELQDKDKSYYFTFKNKNKLYKNGKPKKEWVKVGKYSEGIREQYVSNLRTEQINKMNHGENINLINKKHDKNTKTLTEIAQIYFADKKTAPKQKGKFINHIEPFYGNNNIELIEKKDLLLFRDKLLEGNLVYPKHISEKRNIKVNSKSPQTVNDIIEILKAIYNHYIREYDNKTPNPTLGISKLKTDNNREKYLTIEEINKLLSTIENNKPLWIFIKLSLSTGGRLETILNIQKKDIDLINSTIILKNLKTNETYKGFLEDESIEFLKKTTHDLKPNDYLVSFNNNDKATSRQIQSRLKPILDNLFNENLEKNDSKNRVVIHTLRHTFASHLAINSVPIFTIKELMNHKDIEQTMRYAKLAPDSGKNAVKGLYK